MQRWQAENTREGCGSVEAELGENGEKLVWKESDVGEKVSEEQGRRGEEKGGAAKRRSRKEEGEAREARLVIKIRRVQVAKALVTCRKRERGWGGWWVRECCELL